MRSPSASTRNGTGLLRARKTVHPLFKHGPTNSHSQTECFNTMPLHTKPNFCISLEVS
jgi:hypothetical protein